MILGWGSRSRSVVGTNPSSIQTLSDQSAMPAVFGDAQLSGGKLSEAKLGVQARSVFAGLPLMFEPNQGQGNLDPTDPRAKFVARGSGYSLFLGSEGAILNLRSQASKNEASRRGVKPALARVDSLRMKLAGSNPNAGLTATDLLPSTSNYLLGNDPAKWRRGVPQFARVRYDNVYPGINLIFYGHQGQLEYDFQIAPGSDPSQAELEFDGAKRLDLDHGTLVIKSEGGDVRLEVPRVYQEVAGLQQPIEGKFVLRAANRVGFAIGAYDHSRELVIDPILKYSTYFGGSGDEHLTSIAVDNVGNIYLSGSTTSANLPAATGVYQKTLAGTQNVYIAKINPALVPVANQLIYVTYLGGDGVDSPVGISVDGAGNPYVAGTTTSDNFPTTTLAYQRAPEAGSTGTKHVFVTELNNVNGIASSLIYSSYLSGSGDDIASGVAIDGSGYIYVTGTTTSVETSTTDQFPASNLHETLPFQNVSKAPGLPQFFVTKVYTLGSGDSSIPYSTYFGGGTFETTAPIAVGGGIVVDLNGNIYFTGTTNYTYTGTNSTTDFPILNAYQPCLDEPPPPSISNPEICTPASTDSGSDAFVAKLNPTKTPGQQLQWSTYFGGANTDSGTGIVVDPGATSVYITGTTNSPNLTPVTTAFSGYQICLNTSVNPTPPCPTPSGTPASDAFVAKFANAATSTTIPNISLTYFSYLGGSGNEAGNAISVDSSGGALMTGSTQSTDFPVFPNPNPIQSQLNGAQDAFVARLNSTVSGTGQNTTASWANYFGGSGIDEGTGITIDSTQAIYFAGDTNSTDLQVAGGYQSQNNGGYDAFATQLVTAANLSISGALLASNQGYVSAGNQATFTYTVTNNGPDLANSITVTDDISGAGVGLSVVSAATTSGPPCSVGGSTTLAVSCSIPSLQAGSTATITMILVPTATTNGSSSSFNGGAVTAQAANSTPVQTTVFAQMSDFTMTAGPNSFTLNSAGDSARYTIQLTPHPIFSGSIALTCSGLPNASSCPFTTSPVTLPTTSPGATTMTITTTARPVVTTRVNRLSGRFFAIWLSLPGLALVGFGVGGRRRRRIAGLFLVCFLCGFLLLQPACSSPTQQVPPSGTQAGTYAVTIAATSGSDTKNYTVQLIVP